MNKVIAIIVAVVLIMAPLSIASATMSEGEIQAQEIVEDLVIEYIALVLRSWGVNVTGAQVSEDIDAANAALNQWLLSNVEEYLSLYPSIGGFAEWISDWSFASDYWGNFIGNDNFLDDVYDFLDWLAEANGFENHDYVAVTEAYSIDGLSVFKFPFYAIMKNYPGAGDEQPVIVKIDPSDTTHDPYFCFVKNASDAVALQLFDLSSYSIYIRARIEGQNSNLSTMHPNLNSQYINGLSVSPWYTAYTNNPSLIYSRSYPSYYQADIASALRGNTVDNIGVGLDTTNIDYPTPGTDYQSGDSIKIVIENGEPISIYLNIEFPAQISVDNLPAAISPSGTQDPGFEQAFLPVRAFVNTFHDSMDIMRDIVYRLPSQVVTVFMFIFGVTAIFGALHMFKEH